MAAMPGAVFHTIHIELPEGRRPGTQPIGWRIDLDILRSNSVGLYNLIVGRPDPYEHSTGIYANPPVQPAALGLILEAVSRASLTAGEYHQAALETWQLDLNQLRDLALAIWHNMCSVGLFSSTALETRRVYWQNGNGPIQDVASWMLIALVFNWRDVFEVSSWRLLIDGGPRLLRKSSFTLLPQQLRGKGPWKE